MNPLITFIPDIAKGIFGFFSKKQEIKKLAKSAQSKLEANKAAGELQLKLTDAEWDAIAVKGLDNSWKDEYVTIIMTIPIPLILIGSVMTALGFVSGAQIVAGAIDGIKELKELGMDYGLLLNMVVGAAIGIKMLRS